VEFVAEGEKDKRGMVPISLENALRLVADPPHAASVAGLAEVAGPERQLGLKVDTLLVGCSKTSLRRAVGVESQVVEAPFLQDFEDTPPALDIHRGIASQRKCDTFVCASQEDAVAVEEQRRTICGDFSEAARNLFGIASNGRLKRQDELAEVRRKLAPEREIFVFEIQLLLLQRERLLLEFHIDVYHLRLILLKHH
jgi:hypothetical protein